MYTEKQAFKSKCIYLYGVSLHDIKLFQSLFIFFSIDYTHHPILTKMLVRFFTHYYITGGSFINSFIVAPLANIVSFVSCYASVPRSSQKHPFLFVIFFESFLKEFNLRYSTKICNAVRDQCPSRIRTIHHFLLTL